MSKNRWNLFRGIRLRELDRSKPLASAMPGLDIRLDRTELERLVSDIKGFPGALEAAAREATNATRRFARKEIVSGLKERTTLKAAYIGRAVKTKTAGRGGNGVQAEIRVASARLPLSRYAVNPERPPLLKGVSIAARRRISYTLRTSLHGDRPYKDSEDKSALFVQGMNSGHIGVFYREKGSRSIRQEYAPNIQYHMHASGFMESVVEHSYEKFVSYFREAALLIRGVTP